MKSAIYILLVCWIWKCWGDSSYKSNTVMVALFVRNKAHTLPYFLTQFEELSFPKSRMSLFIRSDHNSDQTIEILENWINYHRKNYHSIDIVLNDTSPSLFPNEYTQSNWTTDRFQHIISLKNEALVKAQNIWADYIWFLDADVFMVDRDVLTRLILTDKPIVSPMLNSLGTYSNFWCGMTENYWYKRTEDYLPILERKRKGCFDVPMVHSSVLIELTRTLSDYLSFHPQDIPLYEGPVDDIIAFAVGAKSIGYQLHVCNDIGFGMIPPPLNDNDQVSKDFQQLIDIKLAILVDNPSLRVSNLLKKYTVPMPTKDKLGFDNIYLINLARRDDRRDRMYSSFDELGLNVQLFEAVDGKKINTSYLESLGIKQLVNYKDPWSKRDMTYGEIGCFLSHYFIWKDIVENKYEKVIVFEDDILFEPYFRSKFEYMTRQMDDLQLDWDLVYLGRKKLKSSDEPWVDGSDIVIHADYSYWTLGYIVTLAGAEKLLAPQPLSKMVPVDEYIPIMFNKNPETEWMEAFSERTLKAFSSHPLMVFPTHYTGDDGYISDTENSVIIQEEVISLQPAANRPIGHQQLYVKNEL